MFHLTNKAWTPYRYYSCHSPGDGWGLVLHACWRQGQGLVMGVDSKNILKCVKHLVASIKIIWLVLLLDRDLDLWFSAEIHSWPRISTGLGVTWAVAGPMTGANCNGYSSHLKHLKPTANPTLLFSPMPQAEPQGSGIWGMVLSCPSIPLSPSLCHGKGKGWREWLCFCSCELSALVTTTSLSCPSYLDTLTASAGSLVRSLPCPGTAAACAACGKTGPTLSDQWGRKLWAVGLKCPPAGHPLKCHLKIEPHKQNLYTPFVFIKNVRKVNIKHTRFVATCQAPAPAMSLLKISRELNREGWWVSFDFELSGDPGLQAEAQLNLTVDMGCIPHPVQVTRGWPE